MRGVLPALCAVLLLAGAAGADPDVLVLGHGGDGPGLVTRLQNAGGVVPDMPGFASVGYQNGLLGTPDIATLNQYDSVLVYTDDAPLFPETLGDVLATFANFGGRLVVATYGMSPGFGIEGTLMTSNHAPLLPPLLGGTSGIGDVKTPLAIVSGQESDPIFTNVTLGDVGFFHNANYAHPTLDASATLLARDSTSSPDTVNMIARSSDGSTLGINVYPANASLTDDGLRLFANALDFERAGSVEITTVADGDWGTGATWDLGTPPDATNDARVRNAVTVTQVGETAASLIVGVGAAGTLAVSAGSLAPGPILLGQDAAGTLTISGGSVTPTGITVGSGAPGTLQLSGGTLSDGGTLLVQDGTLGIVGDLASLSVGALTLSDSATLRVAPSGPGALSTLSSTGVTIHPAASLVLDTSSYTPTSGDSWVLVDFGTGTRTGSFLDVTAEPPLAEGQMLRVILDDASHQIRLRVVTFVVPALPTWGVAWLAASLLAAGVAARGRVRRSAQPSPAATRR